MAIKVFDFKDFSPGIVTVLPPHLSPAGSATICRNIDLSIKYGALVKRLGIAADVTVAAGNDPIEGLYEFPIIGGSTKTVAAHTGAVYDITSGSSAIFTDAGLGGNPVNFTAFNNLLIIVNQGITTQKWTGTGLTANLLGSPPANVKYVEVHKRRVWMANSSAGASRLHYSAIDDPEDWTTTNNAGFIDIDKNDGDSITGIISIGEGLLIFKERSVHMLSGYDVPFTVKRLSSGVGCIAPRSIQRTEGFALFMSTLGVFSASPEGVSLVSYNIKPDVDGWTDAVKRATVGGRYRGQYWLSYDSDADGLNDRAYVLDYINGAWFEYTNIKAHVFFTKSDGALYSGASDTSKTRKHNTGTDDLGSAITMTWRGRSEDFGIFSNDKQVHDISIFALAITGKTLTVTIYKDGVVTGDDMSFPIDPVSSSTTVIANQNAIQSDQGRLIQVEISNAEASASVEVYGYSIMVDIRERQD